MALVAAAFGFRELGRVGGERAAVHMAVLTEPTGVAVVTLECPDGGFPSVGASHAPAIRLERAIRDLYGLEPRGAIDTRPWLDLGCWDVRHPLGAASNRPATRAPYPFLPVEGKSLHQIPVGPVHAGIIEPGHFRFTANGDQTNLTYGHFVIKSGDSKLIGEIR